MQLRLAFEAFAEIGAQGFAERARAELAAAGQRVPRTRTCGAPELTANSRRELARTYAAGPGPSPAGR